jgi:tetratricopeptide (TPR) repeat protein
MPMRAVHGIRIAILIAASMTQAALLASASVESELAFHRGVAAYGEGRLDDARIRFERVLVEFPDDASALQYLSLIALAQGFNDQAADYAGRAQRADPDDLEIQLNLGIALLSANRLEDAAIVLDGVLAADPGNARAEVYRGILDYRRGDYGSAIRHFEAAESADPELKVQTRYYTALAEASLGNVSASAGAFSDVIEQSPAHPLARSAERLLPRIPSEPRAWSVYATTGVELDTNPAVVGDDTIGNFQQDEDVAGIFRAGGQIQVLERKGARLQMGYDGFVSVYSDETDVSQQTHVGWANAVLDRDRVRVSLRYDFAYTALDLSDRFRLLHRVIPSISLRSESWGITRISYEFQMFDFDDKSVDDDFERSGPQHSIGLDQFFLLPEPFTFAQVGGRAITFDSDGTEFDYQGFDVIFGGGVALLWDTSLRLQYRFQYRDYDGRSRVEAKSRIDEVHQVSVDLRIPILEFLDLSIAGSFTFNESKLSFYQYDRQIVGTYLTARY